METVVTVGEVRERVQRARAAGRRITFVPTMGALHAGHASLIVAATTDPKAFAVVSIFVNPIQFGPQEDLARYPRTFAADQELCEAHGAALIFHPSVETMYPRPTRTTVEIQGLGDHLCGATRPGHFRGVCTVVAKLLHIVQPDELWLGAKDAQQARILRAMCEDLDEPVAVKIASTVREADGLALSSRNRYLTSAERSVAPRIYATLLQVQQQFLNGTRSVAVLESMIHEQFREIPGVRIDYATIVDEATLQPILEIDRTAICAVAVHLGATRLIDNLVLEVPPSR